MTHRMLPSQPRAFSKTTVLVIPRFFFFSLRLVAKVKLFFFFYYFFPAAIGEHGVASHGGRQLETGAIHRFGGRNFAHQVQCNGLQRQVVRRDLECGDYARVNARVQFVLSDVFAGRVLLEAVHVHPRHFVVAIFAVVVRQRCRGSCPGKRSRCRAGS